MKLLSTLTVAAFVAVPLYAETARHADSHEHGVGKLNIAFEGSKISMELEAPGADIVGFEYEAETDADKTAIDDAVALLSKPLDLLGLPAAAGCQLMEVHAGLEEEGHHDDHDDGDHDDHHDEDDHDDHDDKDHDDHDDHDDKDHDDHDDHDKDDHADHDDDNEASHTEFHAEYLLECSNVSAAAKMTFPYFAAFPNAKELELQVVTDKGASAYEVERDEPSVDLSALF